MPNLSAQPSPRLSRIFQSLADPTRRAVIERLGKGPMAMSELHQPFDMALPSFSQHLAMLEECGLVRSSKSGRVRTFELNTRTFLLAERWMDRQKAQWTKRLDQLDAYLQAMKEKEK